MKLTFTEVKEKPTVYVATDRVMFIANPGKTGYIPNFSYTCVPVKSFEAIQAIVAECKTKGEARKTALNKDALDLTKAGYAVSVITLADSTLIEVEVVDKKSEVNGLKLTWLEDKNGNTSFKSNGQYVFFTQSGNNRFDFGFKRVHAKLAKTTYDPINKKWVEYYDEASYLTVTTGRTTQDFIRAAKGMNILEQAIAVAEKNIKPADSAPFEVGEIPDLAM